MYALSFASVALLASSAAAKKCTNITVPVDISARTGVFDITVPKTNLEATTFIQNFTQQGRNFTNLALTGYKTTAGTYNISTQFCVPSENGVKNPTVQVLTHGIGFDRTYWDIPYNGFNYSYIDVAVDTYKYNTLSYDRLGIGQSSHGEPLNEIQAFLEIAALASLTTKLRQGTFPGINHAFPKVTHVGHSFGSAQTYALVNLYPTISDGIVLTGFSMNASFVGYFAAGADFVLASRNQPFRFGTVPYATGDAILASLASIFKVSTAVEEQLSEAYGLTDYFAGLETRQRVEYCDGYLANKDVDTTQYLFLLPGHFDPGILYAGERTKQPVTVGELLTLGSAPMVNAFKGPVLVLTGSNDLPYCGGDCLATGDPTLPSIPAAVRKNFPNVPAADFEAYIQPQTGHGLNFHYNATGAYRVAQEFLRVKGL